MVATFNPQTELQSFAHLISKNQILPAAQFKGATKYEGRVRVRRADNADVSFELLDDTWAGAGIAENDIFFAEFGGIAVQGAWFLRTVIGGEQRNVDPVGPSPEILNTLIQAVSSDPIYPNRVRGVRDQIVDLRLSDFVTLNNINHRSRGTLGETWGSDNLRQLTFAGAVSGLWRVGAGAVGATSGAVGTVVGLSPAITQGGEGHFVIVDVGVDYAGAEFTLGEVVDSTGGAAGTLRADALGARSISPLLRPQRVGTTPSLLDYRTLVLSDMGVVSGSFFEMQDGTISPLTDSGPDASVDMIAKDPGITIESDGPWPGAKAMRNDAGLEFRDFTGNSAMFGANTPDAFDGWFKQVSTTGTQNLMLSDNGPRLSRQNLTALRSLILGPSEPQAPDWTALTVYAQGARVNDPGATQFIFEAEVAGTSDAAEPTWPGNQLTVVDGTVTWRNIGFRSSLHNSGQITGSFVPTLGEWFHAAFVRLAGEGGWKVYINGVEDLGMAIPIAADNTTPGSFGVPKPFTIGKDYSPGSGTSSAGQGFAIGGSGVDGEEQWRGSIAYVATYRKSLTAAKIKAHFDLGVALGLNT